MNGMIEAAEQADLQTGGARIWRFNERVLDERTLSLQVEGQIVELRGKPLQVLVHLLRHAGDIVTKEELFQAVWPGRILSESVLAKAVHEIRSAIRDEAQESIRTVHGYGYRLVANVSIEHRVSTSARGSSTLKEFDPVPSRQGWKLRRRLGLGGHGEAWLGQHEKSAELRVFKFARDLQQLTSLKREITLYRLLNEALGDKSPSLPLYEWNLEEPPYFIEMHYATSGSLQQWAEAVGGLHAVSLHTRLNIAAQIADGLAAVHSVGVLHKDLKPSNVLIVGPSSDPIRVSLSDFGSGALVAANRLDEYGITQLGFTETREGTTGTALYIAPEVLAGQPATTKADMYALGVILYQLVVGDFRRALAPGWEHDVEDELLRADIAAAASGALERRLSDPSVLGRRLRQLDERRRSLAHERAAADRSRVLQESALRAQENLSRTKARAIWASLLCGALVLGIAASLFEFREAVHARDEARSVSRFITHDLLSVANPLFGPASDWSLGGILKRAAGNLDSDLAEYPNSIAELKLALGWGYALTQGPEHGLKLVEDAAELSEHLYGRHDLRTLRVLDNLAFFYALSQGKSALAEKLLRETGAQYEGRIRSNHLYALGHRRIWANLLLRQQKYDEAIEELRAVANATIEDRPEEPGILDKEDDPPALANWDLPLALIFASRYPEAEAASKRALGELPKSPLLREGLDYLMGREQTYLGYVLIQLGKYGEAEAAFDAAEQRLARALVSDHSELRDVRAYRALLLVEQGSFEAAANRLRPELAHCTVPKCQGTNPLLLSYLGLAYAGLGQWNESLDNLSKAAKSSSEHWGPTHESTIRAYAELADAYRQLGRTADAWASLRMVPESALAQLPDQHVAAATYNRVRGLLLLERKEYAAARDALKDALQTFELRHGPAHWRTKRARSELESAGLRKT